MMLTIALIKTGSAWDTGTVADEERLLGEHVAYVRQLAEHGDVIQSGMILAPGERPGADGLVGMILFATDIDRARELASACPATVAGMVRCEVHPWYLTAAAAPARTG